MIRSTLLSFSLLCALTAHSEERCIGPVLSFAMSDFEVARANGLTAYDNDNKTVNLGAHVRVRGLAVQDDAKESYTVTVRASTDLKNLSDVVLTTVISGVDPRSCDLNRKTGLSRYLLRTDTCQCEL